MKQRDAALDFAVPLGTERLQDVVPAEQEWPRTVVTVTRQSEEDKAPDLLVLTQATARDPYQLVAYTEMAGGATLPLTGGTDQGVEALAPDAEGRLMTPAAAMAAYADVLTTGHGEPERGPVRREHLHRRRPGRAGEHAEGARRRLRQLLHVRRHAHPAGRAAVVLRHRGRRRAGRRRAGRR